MMKNLWKPLLGVSALAAILIGTSKKKEEVIAAPIPSPSPGNDRVNTSDAQQRAEQLYEAMKMPGQATGFKTEQIKEALNGLNARDFNLVSQAFGTRRYQDSLKSAGIWPDDDLSLKQWLEKELPGNIFNQIKQKGIL